MKQTIEATFLALAVCASLFTGFSRGEALGAAAGKPQKAAPKPAVIQPVAAAVATVEHSNPEEAWDLPNLDHARVDYWIGRYTTDLRSSFAIFLNRMTTYQPMIESKLEQHDMPKELIYLALIESGFNPTASSPVRAKGLWQFMTATAQQYGLTVTRHNDERTDPEKSTEAALSYLEDLHERFGAWYLAAAAYNTGEGRIASLMKKFTGSEKGSEADYYAISSRLPQETRDYVPKMIAAARIAKEPQKYGFDLGEKGA
jgi:peptidoglycan lytic transglycosylase D